MTILNTKVVVGRLETKTAKSGREYSTLKLILNGYVLIPEINELEKRSTVITVFVNPEDEIPEAGSSAKVNLEVFCRDNKVSFSLKTIKLLSAPFHGKKIEAVKGGNK